MSHGPGPGRGGNAPGTKAKNFRGTWRRLLGELRPERWRISVVVVLTTVAVVLNVIAPRVLGHATNIVYEGVSGLVVDSWK